MRGLGERRLPSSRIGGVDEGLKDVEGHALNPVTEQESLGAGEPVQGGDEPEDETVVEFEGGAGLAGAAAGVG